MLLLNTADGGAWRLTSMFREKPSRGEIRTMTMGLIKSEHFKRLIRNRLKLMGCLAICDLKENQLQTYYNFLNTLL